jgi:L-threonylcarbamoyladenylate synthase
VRWPSHPLIQEVIRLGGFPLAAPSANPASQLSPTEAAHVRGSLGGKIPLIVDGGPSHVGIESTVLDLSHQSPRILRPGMIDARALQAALGEEDGGLRMEDGAAPAASGGPLRSPGQLPKHYSPRARLVIWEWRSEADLKSQISNFKFEMKQAHIIAHTRIPLGEGFGRVNVIPLDPEAFARAIYAELHRCDQQGAELIVVEALPPDVAWQAIADRLHRAASL